MYDDEVQEIVLDCLAANYGIGGSLTRLPGENLNFLVHQDDGAKYVSKIVDDHMPPAVVEMEFEAIEYAVASGFEAQLPRIKENIYGNIETGINLPINGVYRLRLSDFIVGIELSNISDISEELLIDLGKTVASFDVTMQGFDHPAAHRKHRWNLAEADQHKEKISLIEDPENRSLLSWAFRTWRAARGRLGGLPWQVIHGDAHDENILIEEEQICGMIDFGDCCHNPTVCDLAICLTYLMMRGEDPLRFARLITDGYRTVRLLSPAESAMLYPMVCARLAVSVCVASKRRTIDPGNPNWFGGERAAWKLLQRLRTGGAGEFDRALGAS